jgi:hypothetical protein
MKIILEVPVINVSDLLDSKRTWQSDKIEEKLKAANRGQYYQLQNFCRDLRDAIVS